MSAVEDVTGVKQPSEPGLWPHSGWAWFAVAGLMVAYTSSFIDRQILTLLVQPIRADLTITDTQFSLLAGIAFSLFYTVMGVPLARLADRGSRRWIIFWGIVVWSVMTVACGLANSFWALFAARIGVGIGEAALSPAAYSMISDYFPPRQRARALAVYSMAPYLGAGLALMIGGAVIDIIAQAGAMKLPFVGELAPWQQTFVLVGAPGLLIAALFVIVREPPRQGVVKSGVQAGVLGYMWSRKSTFYMLIFAFSIFGMAGISYLAWAPAVLIRQHGMTPAEVGFAYGLVLLAAATPGVLVGGWLTDMFAGKGRTDAPVRVAILALVASIPFAIAMPLMPDRDQALAALAGFSFFAGVMNSLPATALQAVAPNQLRAQITAIYFLIGNLISLGLGPTVVAAISDNWLGGDQRIGLSLAIVSGATITVAALMLTRALRPFRDSVEEARAWQEPAQ
ncbi:MFS transporter [Brevundimonas sp. AJA228-03]|uniref:spinster family MFS transporter n=1 Tax=Brevundimonas sp. AJA228-03 TaxID=2752515 RepID=UPI001ADFC677|nr:MFS transporter [Brevundimonas sp. AJA228-03]QTN18311.1 MFS transporter [Brevundimonas sp. AJA228-03]